MRQRERLQPGSFTNYLMANNSSVPEVGKGATVMHYSDRSVYEVVEVSEDKKRVRLQALEASWDRTKPGGEGHQNWVFTPMNQFITVVWRNHRGGGAWYTEHDTVTYTKEYIAAQDSNLLLAQTLTDEQHQQVYAGQLYPQNVVPGITRRTKKYDRIRILFGRKDYYYDWEF